MVKIDKGVPMHAAKRGRKRLYPWADMKPGDSFFAPVTRGSLKANAAYYTKLNGTKYHVATEGNGARCWRVS